MKNYFKKFSIMFVMLLAVIGAGVIQNGSVANAATVGQQLLQPEDGWKRYDDSSSGISFTGALSRTGDSYFIINKADSYKGTVLSTPWNRNTENTSFSFGFYGSKLRIISPMWSSCSGSSAVYIDNVLVGKYSAHSTYSNSGLQKLVYEINGLSLAKHSLKVVNEDNTQYFTLDAIDIDRDGYLMPYSEAIKNELISLNKTLIDLTSGNSEQLIVTTTPAGAELVWTSSDESIATVDLTGKVTGVKEGQVTVTAQIKGSDTKASCIVNVTKKTEPTSPTDNNGGTDGTTNIVNIAHAKGDNTNNAGGDVSIIFKGVAEAQLSVVKTADVGSVYVGDTFTYTIVVTNTSSKTAKSVVMSDNAPNHINFSVSGVTTTQGKVDSSSTSKNIIVNVGDILPSETVTIKIPATVIL